MIFRVILFLWIWIIFLVLVHFFSTSANTFDIKLFWMMLLIICILLFDTQLGLVLCIANISTDLVTTCLENIYGNSFSSTWIVIIELLLFLGILLPAAVIYYAEALTCLFIDELQTLFRAKFVWFYVTRINRTTLFTVSSALFILLFSIHRSAHNVLNILAATMLNLMDLASLLEGNVFIMSYFQLCFFTTWYLLTAAL